jgi:hypothetical protein
MTTASQSRPERFRFLRGRYRASSLFQSVNRVGFAMSAIGLLACPYRKPHPASEQTKNRVMFVPDDRFSQVAGMRADQALPIEGTA